MKEKKTKNATFDRKAPKTKYCIVLEEWLVPYDPKDPLEITIKQKNSILL